MTGTVLILGGSGRFGRNAAEAFWNRGWSLRSFDRARDDLTEAARGVDVIVNAWNPPYDRWAAELPGLTRAVIGAAQSSGATVVIPGNVYVYGAQAPEVWGPEVPHGATNPLGRLRVQMEAAYRAALVRTIVLRAGDFLDVEASGNWFDRVIAQKIDRGVLRYPGAVDAPHAWAFLPDVARAAEMLARQRSDLPVFADVPFAGYTLSGAEMGTIMERIMGQQVRVERMAWWPLHLAQPVWPMARHLLEMRYLWSKPQRLAPETFDALLPDFAMTPPEVALSQAIAPLLSEMRRAPVMAQA